MENKERLISLDYALRQIKMGELEHMGIFVTDSSHMKDFLNVLPIVDAVPVDTFKLHHLIINNEGIPEVKLQFGDKFVTLYTDPVDVREVVHGHWIEEYVYAADPHDRLRYKCSVCGRTEEDKEPYCNCGAKMDGGRN